MWIAKIKTSGEGGLFGSRAKKHNVSIAGYPIAVRKKEDYLLIDMVAFLFGKNQNKKRFVNDLKKSKEIVNLEVNGDFMIAQVKDPKELEPAYPESIINIEPVLIDSNGDNFYTIGSWDRGELNKFLDFVSKRYEVELLKIGKRKLSNFSLAKLRPELTEKQKSAIELAIKNGYYKYPRKTSVEKLAKISKISFSAFHAHLRKAEQKLLPFYLEK